MEMKALPPVTLVMVAAGDRAESPFCGARSLEEHADRRAALEEKAGADLRLERRLSCLSCCEWDTGACLAWGHRASCVPDGSEPPHSKGNNRRFRR